MKSTPGLMSCCRLLLLQAYLRHQLLKFQQQQPTSSEMTSEITKRPLKLVILLKTSLKKERNLYFEQFTSTVVIFDLLLRTELKNGCMLLSRTVASYRLSLSHHS